MKWIFLLGTPIAGFVTAIFEAAKTGSPEAVILAIITGGSTLAGWMMKISDGNYKKEIES